MARKPKETLADLILASGLPYNELAEKSGTAVRTLHSLRAGRVASPHVRTIAGLAKALGVEPQRLLAAIAETVKQAG